MVLLDERMERCHDWNDTVPHYGDPLILVPTLKALLHVGSTVSITGDYDFFNYITDVKTKLFYGRIVNMVHDNELDYNKKSIVLNILLPFKQSMAKKNRVSDSTW